MRPQWMRDELLIWVLGNGKTRGSALEGVALWKVKNVHPPPSWLSLTSLALYKIQCDTPHP